MPGMGESYEVADHAEDVLADAFGGIRILLCDELPDLENVSRGARVKFKSLGCAHFGGRRLSNSSSRRRKSSKNVSPSTDLTRPLLRSS